MRSDRYSLNSAAKRRTMDLLPEIVISTHARSTSRRAGVRRSAGRKNRQQQNILLAGLLFAFLAVAGGFASQELLKGRAKKRGIRGTPSRKTSVAANTRIHASAEKKVPQKAATANAITAEQFHSVPQGALRFRVEDIFGSPLHSTHDFEEVERFGSNGEIFGSEFVNTFLLAYKISGRPGKIAVFMFQGQSTNPPLVDKQIHSE